MVIKPAETLSIGITEVRRSLKPNELGQHQHRQPADISASPKYIQGTRLIKSDLELETGGTGCSASQERKPLPMGIAININVNLPIYNKTPTYKPLPQLTRRQRSFFESAKAASLLSDYPKFHLGCVVVKKSRIISSGHNSITQYSSIQQKMDFKRFGGEHRGACHAETAALIPLIRQRADLSSCVVYLYREHSDGTPVVSRPCSGCMSLLRAVGIRRVFFTVEGGYAIEDI